MPNHNAKVFKFIDTIIFDLEGVIIDTQQIWDDETTTFLQRRNHKADTEKMRVLLSGTQLEVGLEVMRKHYPFEGDTKELASERREIAKELFSKEVDFIPGFMVFYNKVRRKYKLAVATSMERGYFSIVDRRLHIAKLFNNHVYSIDDIGHIGKPHPDIFLYAAKKLKSLPKRCIVIEDAPNGIEAAKKAEMRVIAITTTIKKEKLLEADKIVNNFDEIRL